MTSDPCRGDDDRPRQGGTSGSPRIAGANAKQASVDEKCIVKRQYEPHTMGRWMEAQVGARQNRVSQRQKDATRPTAQPLPRGAALPGTFATHVRVIRHARGRKRRTQRRCTAAGRTRKVHSSTDDATSARRHCAPKSASRRHQGHTWGHDERLGVSGRHLATAPCRCASHAAFEI